MLFDRALLEQSPLREAITNAYQMDEESLLKVLLEKASLTPIQEQQLNQTARNLVVSVRQAKQGGSGIDAFLKQFQLSSGEGIALMCLAEALLRVPDKDTIDALIRDKLASADWHAHLGQSDSFAINATTWALMLTGKMLRKSPSRTKIQSQLKSFVSRSSEPVIRKAVEQAMRIMSRQFVMGRTIDEAIKRAEQQESRGFRYSYDMLGEAALTQADADRYFDDYARAIERIGKHAQSQSRDDRAGISVKLSALHPRYELIQRERVLRELVPRVLLLAQQAKQYDIDLTIDAEEARRLELSFDIIEAVFTDPSLQGWEGFGIALQSYQKRAWFVIDWLIELCQRSGRRMKVRLIKGAYWDSEIKDSQMNGYESFPVFTHKPATDVSFQACAIKLLANNQYFYLQFATHNAYSVALILTLAQEGHHQYEFQCLHGMGSALYEQIVPDDKRNIPCRIYAPVGSHEDLLPYLVRRLLENGANSSFVNRIVDARAPIEALIASPITAVQNWLAAKEIKIPLPKNIFAPHRENSHGFNIYHRHELSELDGAISDAAKRSWQGGPIVSGRFIKGNETTGLSPVNHDWVVGSVSQADVAIADQAVAAAKAAFPTWTQRLVAERAACVDRMADLLEQHRYDFYYLASREAGKTIPDAIAEVREAIDFCRYYAAQALDTLAEPESFTGYTGETNELRRVGRGVMLCISPWNFPLAIFIGQIAACLVSGNCVVAKPAGQTTIIATHAMKLFHQAGVPQDVVHLLPGPGSSMGNHLVQHPDIAGVLLTGSTDTARVINQTLAARPGPILPLIAETGGQNAMIVDSSALLEQVVVDTIQSAFGSAGQRCSALRVCYVQEDVAERFCTLLSGAMRELRLGDPLQFNTDIGPVIDSAAHKQLQAHIDRMDNEARLLAVVPLNEACKNGTFIAPRAYILSSIEQLHGEVFGPILHIIPYKKSGINKVIDDINSTGFGLTFGIHSRVNHVIDDICQRVHVGNCYVNRNMIGAVVGLQPFGGEGLSGTGPKAGGPHYLSRLMHERTITINTTAAGGNATLMSL